MSDFNNTLDDGFDISDDFNINDYVRDDGMFDFENLQGGETNPALASNMMESTTTAQPATQQPFMPNQVWWDARNSMQLLNGAMVAGKNSELWQNYAELRPALMGMWQSDNMTLQPEPVASTPPFYPAPSMSQQTFAYPTTPAQAMASPASGYPTPNTYQQLASPTPASAARPMRRTATKRKPRPAAAPSPSLPPYQVSADLSSAADAREYLSKFDPQESQLLRIRADDVDMVRNNIQTYAGKVYAVLLHAYDANALHHDDDRYAKFVDQQEVRTTELQKMLKTPAQFKAAQAAALLMVDAAIQIHISGVSLERYNKHHAAASNGLKSDDSYLISTNLDCSARVDAMVAQVKANKLVAKDVLEGKNLLRFAECPDAYTRRKFSYLRSNTTRQTKVERRAADDEAKGVAGRSETLKKAKSVQYAETDDGDAEYLP